MSKWINPVIFAVALALLPIYGRDKPAIVVHAFTAASGVTFPYDMNLLQNKAINMLNAKDAALFQAAADAPAAPARVFILDGEILEWHKGNAAERLLLAAGTVAGRENAKIHFWLTAPDGRKVYENTDTIRQGFMKNGHEKNTGTLITPFAEKLTERLKEANLAQ